MNKKQKQEIIDKAFKVLKSKWFTKREREVIITVYKQKVLCIKQLEEIHFKRRANNRNLINNNSRMIALRRIKKLVDNDILIMFWYGYNYQGVMQHYILGPVGKCLVSSFLGIDLEITEQEPLKLPNITHTIGINDIRTYFDKVATVLDFKVEQNCRIVYDSNQLEPDAYIKFVVNRNICEAFIESDRGTMSKDKIKEKIKRYEKLYLSKEWEEQFKLFPYILFIVPTTNRLRQISNWILKYKRTDITFLVATENLIKENILGKVWLLPESNRCIALI